MSEEEELARVHSFIEKAEGLEEGISQDMDKARQILKFLQEHADFKALFEQRKEESEQLLEMCHRFSEAVIHLTKEYPELIAIYRGLLTKLLEDLKKDENFEIRIAEMDVIIRVKDEEFQYNWSAKHPGREFLVFDESRSSRLGPFRRKLKKLLKEVAEILELDLHIGRYLTHIERNKAGTIQHVEDAAEAMEQIREIDDGRLVPVMHILTMWFMEIIEFLQNVERSSQRARKMNKSLRKQFQRLRSGEDIEILDKKFIIAKYILAGVTGVAASVFIPGSSEIKKIFKAKKSYEEYRQDLAEAQAKIERLERLAA